ncbi:MAG: PEP-CTERM sorting domain-containing protein [Sphaerospermopsis sp. SIO1G1]|nr:PEP-CTERM sorting domain-containing protein [Sphaerospermopsis sp. SIO1G1]
MKRITKILIFAICTIGISELNIQSAVAAQLRSVRGINIFGDAIGFDVEASWFWGAHPGGNDQKKGKVSAANPRVELQSSFNNDDHGSMAAGNVLYKKVRDVQGPGGTRLIEASSEATAIVKPVCPEPPPEKPKCGKISLLTIADGKIIFRVRGNEINRNEISPGNPQLSITPSLGTGTILSLGSKGSLSDSIIVGNSSIVLYKLDYEVVLEDDPTESGNPLIRDQKIVASLTAGISDSLFSVGFDNNLQAIESKFINAFEYDPLNNSWNINQDTPLFVVSTSAQQDISNFILSSSDTIEDSSTESVPEPPTILGAVIVLGVAIFLKR